MAPSLYSSDNTRTYISLQPLAASQTTREVVRDQAEQEEREEREVEEEEEGEEGQDQEPPRRQPRSNLRRAPSQANMHHTTVPQAITPSQLGSRKGNCHCQPLSLCPTVSLQSIMESQVQISTLYLQEFSWFH